MKNQRMLYYFFTLLILALMVGVAEATGEKEIIFPEITAITIGALIAPKQSWNVSPLRLLITVTAMSVCGILIVRLVPCPKFVTLPLALLVSCVSLVISKTSFAPQVSACVLPVVLGTTSLIYPASVIVMTTLILLTQYIFVKMGKYKYREFLPIEITGKIIKYYALQFVIVSLIFLIPALTKQMFFVVPPLIVGYLEMCEKGSKVSENKLLSVAMIFSGTLLGTLFRLILTEKLGVPLTVSAVLACVILFFIMSKSKLYFPPCGAICTLPMLLSAEKLWLYPFEATIGFIIMALVSRLDLVSKIKEH